MLPRALCAAPTCPSPWSCTRGPAQFRASPQTGTPHAPLPATLTGSIPAAAAPPPPAPPRPQRLLRQIYRDVHTLNRKLCLIYKCNFN